MIVYVNNIEVRVFAGATAGNAIQSYYRAIQSAIPCPLPLIYDKYGNEIEPDGELTAKNHLFILESTNFINHE